jgi:hypothetical protein
MEKIIDSYKQFFELFSQDIFFNFGLNNIITIDKNIAKNEWKKLLEKINKKSDDLHVRDFGRRGDGNQRLTKFYDEIFNLRIKFDPTNNSKPTQLLQNLTGYQKNKNIFNYQVSHVFGNTKNVYCFTAPWNIVFIPKIIDPFTGHESKGDYVNKFQQLFKNKLYETFFEEITEYNKIMDSKKKDIDSWVENNIEKNKQENFIKEFRKIEINN